MFRRSWSGSALPALGVALAAGAAAQPSAEQQPPAGPAQRVFSASFDSLSLDLRSNKSIYTNVVISDGKVVIKAAEGTTDETNFEDSKWDFAGGVSIAVETAVLTAATATFAFEDSALAFGELNGEPVEITDVVDAQQTVHGTADRIVFDNDAGTAALYGRATLSIGANEYTGCDLVYHFAEKTFNSGSSDCGVLFTIFPDEPGDADGAAPLAR